MKKILLLTFPLLLFIAFAGTVSAGEYVYRPYYDQETRHNDGNYYDLNDLDHGKAYSWGIDLKAADSNGQTIDFSSESIIGATLYFDDIRNWEESYSDAGETSRYSNAMFVSALNNPTVGVQAYDDNASGETNYFNTGDALLFQWEDINETVRDIAITLTNDANKDMLLAMPEFIDNNYYRTDKTVYDGDGTNPGDPSTDPDATLWDGVGDAGELYVSEDAFDTLMSYVNNYVMDLGFDPDCHFWNNGLSLTLWTKDKPGPNTAIPEPATFVLFGFGLLGFASHLRRKTNMVS